MLVYNSGLYRKIGAADRVSVLLEAGANVDAVHVLSEDTAHSDSNSCTALYAAACAGHGAAAQRLLSAKADVNKPGSHGRTPLHAAAQACSDSVVRSDL